MARFGNPARERKTLEATYEDLLLVLRPADVTEGAVTRVVFMQQGDAVVCALCQTTAAADQTDTFNRLEYSDKVLASPEVDIQPGDRLVVQRFGRDDPDSALLYEYEPAGKAAVYPTHQEVLLKGRNKA